MPIRARRYAPPETDVLRRYLEGGGSAMLLVEPDYALDDSIAALLAERRHRGRDGVIVDPTEHYFTDEQMIAVTRYGQPSCHARPGAVLLSRRAAVEAGPAPGVKATALFASSADSYVIANRLRGPNKAKSGPRASQIIALAAEGRLNGSAAAAFRLIVAGDADFATNSFFPYLANSDAVLAGIRG